MMRKLRVLLIAVACAVMLAVPTLAYTEVDISGNVGITVQDGNTYLATVPASTLNDEGKGYWDKAMQVLTGQSSDYKVILRYNQGSYFVDVFGPESVMTVVSGAVRVSSHVARLSYTASANNLYYWPRSGVAADMLGVYISWGDFALPDTAQIATYQGQFGIIDDLNNPMPEPTPKPEPEVPFEPAGPPSYEGDAAGLPYDVGVFDALMWYLRDAIGNVSKVLILIAFLLVILASLIAMFWHYIFHRGDGGQL